MNCKSRGKSVVEIKCPHQIWNKTIKDSFKYLDILTLNTSSNISINKRRKYYTQNNSHMVLAASMYGQQIVFSWTKLIKVSINLDVRLKVILLKLYLVFSHLNFVANVARSWWKRKKLVKMNTISKAFFMIDANFGIISSVSLLIRDRP